MSRSTPRKSRHRQNPSGGAAVGASSSNNHGGPVGGVGSGMMGVSDYESDAAHYMENRAAPAAPQIPNPHRTNTELNLSVLRRYLPSISAIPSIAANAVVYTFDPHTQEWDKSGVEGTMFVCNQEPLAVPSVGGSWTYVPRGCVFVLNRRGLDNLIIDLARVSHCEVSPELLILSMQEESSSGSREPPASSEIKVLGLWIHADQEDTREKNSAAIQQLWGDVRKGSSQPPLVPPPQQQQQQQQVPSSSSGKGESAGPAVQVLGRKVSLSDLFGRPKEAGPSNPT